MITGDGKLIWYKSAAGTWLLDEAETERAKKKSEDCGKNEEIARPNIFYAKKSYDASTHLTKTLHMHHTCTKQAPRLHCTCGTHATRI